MSEMMSELHRSVADLPVASRAQLLEAVAATCLLIARADGQVSVGEMQRIAGALAVVGEGPEAERVDRTLEGHWRELEERGLDSLLANLAGQLPDPHQRQLALAFAVFVACADGHADPAEERLLLRMAAAFSLPTDEVSRLLAQTAS